MSHTRLSLALSAWVAIVLVLAATVLITHAAPKSVASDLDRRAGRSDGAAPNISAIDSPAPSCYRVNVGVCYIQWNYLSVSASASQYIVSMTVSIDGRIRAYQSGFFQSSMYIPGDLFKPGFKVACGSHGASNGSGLGYSYNYVIRAAETGGLPAASYGTVTCPANVGTVFMPLVVKR